MKPVISVIIPVYNAEKYLRECIDSVLAQTFRDFELILVDDGSTDGSGAICDEYAAKHGFVSVIHKVNGGPISARKAGVDASSGKYLTFIDSDDSIEPDMYKEMSAKALEYDADIVLSDMIIESLNGDQHRGNLIEPGFYDKERLRKEVYPTMLIGGENGASSVIPSMCNKLFKRELLKNVLVDFEESIRFGEDALCSFPCLLDADKIYVMGKAYYHYRNVPTSIMHTYDSGLVNKSLHLIELFDKAFKERGFDGKGQLDYYAVRIAIECIRSELLFNKDLSVKGRIAKVRAYAKTPRLEEAFRTVYSSGGFGDVNDTKVEMIIGGRFLTLFLIFFIKNIGLKLRKK